MGNCLVTFIVQNKNYACYLPQCLNSIVNQKGLSRINHEILGLDAGSTDNSREIYREMIGDYVDVSGLNQAEALNVALKMAKGEYIAWINSDDLYTSNFLTDYLKAFNHVHHNDVSVVCGIGIFVKADHFFNMKIQHPTLYYVLRNLYGSNRGLLRILKHDIGNLYTRAHICQPATLIKKEWLHRVGGWNENLTYVIDLDLWFRLATVSYLAFLPKVDSIVRMHGHNLGFTQHDRQEKEAEFVRKKFANTHLNSMISI